MRRYPQSRRLALVAHGLLLIVVCRPAAAQGWFQVPNTKLEDVCPPGTPDYDFPSYCSGVIGAWNGGIADIRRNRLIVWGGGHLNYFGNELYAFNLIGGTFTRLNDPSPINPDSAQCIEALSDGRPNARETYNGLAYIAHADRMFVFGGALACDAGEYSRETWTLDLSTLQWTRMSLRGDTPAAAPGVVADYDPVTRKVFLHDVVGDFWKYDFDANTYTHLASGDGIDYHMTGVIDPVRRLFFIFGNGSAYKVDISGNDPTYTIWEISSQVRGCGLMLSEIYPGLAFDSSRSMVVGWAGGYTVEQSNTVYLFNSDTLCCSTVTYPGGPGPQQDNGTLGRWRYFPGLGVFALVNDWQQDGFAFRLP